MILIPAGEFIMGGSDEFEPVIAMPVHTVYLNDFAIDKFEVTNVLYKACVDAGICEPPKSSKSYTHPSYYGDPQFNHYPVIQVNWQMAKTYCEWRGGRLPTEAEWEKAARGTDGRTYPWGEEIDCNHANWGGYQDSQGNIGCPVSSVPSEQSTSFPLARIFPLFGVVTGDTKAVGSFPRGKSPYSVFDMGGNVGEWVLDWFSLTYYQESPPENPPGPELGSERIYRGGDYSSYSYDLSVWNRQSSPPEAQQDWIGFRCARSVP